MRTNLKIVWAGMTIVAALLSGACLTPSAIGEWWACRDYHAADGTVSGCRPIDRPAVAR